MDESVVKVFEEQRIGKLKLSEAMRIGARLRPQGRLVLFDGERTCAIGAAMEARGWAPNIFSSPKHLVPELMSGEACRMLWFEISDRNDQGWAREAIADWLEARGY